MEHLFVGYSSQPSVLRETLAEVSTRLGRQSHIGSAVSWEDLRVDGRLIVNEIEGAIDSCTVGVFDLTTLNNNVLFELGLAVGKSKRVVIVRDAQDREAEKKWKDFALLTTTGYTGYNNADDLVAKLTAIVSTEQPPLLDDLMSSLESQHDPGRLLIVPSMKQDDPGRKLSRVINQYDRFVVAELDLADYGSAPLAWFVQEVYRSQIAILHLTPSRAHLADIANPRVSLLAGIARGLGRDVALVAENGELAALDYRDLAIMYSDARSLERQLHAWMGALRPPARGSPVPRVRKHLSAELAALKFGNHVAEGEQEGLDRYFVETRDYKDVLEAYATIFTGRKGTGKTANMLQAAEALQGDARNLVCVIKPAGYELEGLLYVLRSVEARHLNDYLIEALWKYLIYTDVAAQGVEDAESRPAGVATGSPLDALRLCLERRHGGVHASFSERLEKLIVSLEQLADLSNDDISESRRRIGAALYGDTLRELREKIGTALASKQRVAILIDNLDKAWERGADLELLARLLLGLLSVVGRIADEFRKEDGRRHSINLTLTVFLRSDIFAFVRDRAREPDKISVSEIAWRDRDLLARVLEDRFLATRPVETDPSDLWTQYFAHEVRGVATRDYILNRVLPRPRDLVFFGNAAVVRAANAKHSVVDESDILEAERDYSQFAYEALLVEGVAASVDLEPVLIEFAGEASILRGERVDELLTPHSSTDLSLDNLVAVLRRHGFLGIETTEDHFDYGGTEPEIRRADVRVRKLERAQGVRARYEVNAAYRNYLEIDEDYQL